MPILRGGRHHDIRPRDTDTGKRHGAPQARVLRVCGLSGMWGAGRHGRAGLHEPRERDKGGATGMEQERWNLMGITEILMIVAAACLILGLVADTVTDSDRAGNALILLAIIAMLAAFFTVEAPPYLRDVDAGQDIPREMRD